MIMIDFNMSMALPEAILVLTAKNVHKIGFLIYFIIIKMLGKKALVGF